MSINLVPSDYEMKEHGAMMRRISSHMSGSRAVSKMLKVFTDWFAVNGLAA